jgi:hypothetical protein
MCVCVCVCVCARARVMSNAIPSDYQEGFEVYKLVDMQLSTIAWKIQTVK